ncbi:MAG TPA: hypothetical protein VGL62_09415, partial [Vicinamibacterales bacterium]
HVFDPEIHPAGSPLFKQVLIGASTDAAPIGPWERPVTGSALVGSQIRRPDGSDARFIVAANGGSDLIYVPDGSTETVREIVNRVVTYDYVGGVFVDDRYGDLPGTLPLSAINLVGDSKVPRPAVIVAFKHFYADPSDLKSGHQVCDSWLQPGQGNHGGFGRESTFNYFAAIGPDFKRRFTDPMPAGNMDIAPTLAHLLGFDLARGPLVGRVLTEALAGGAPPSAARVQYQRSTPANGRETVLVYQQNGGERYLDAACFVPTSTADAGICRQ